MQLIVEALSAFAWPFTCVAALLIIRGPRARCWSSLSRREQNSFTEGEPCN